MAPTHSRPEEAGAATVHEDTSRLVARATDALIRSMAGDEAPQWRLTLEGYAELFARASHVAAAELQRSRAEVAARPDLAPEAAGEWRPKLRRLLEADPGAAERLGDLLRRLDAPAPEGTANTVDGGVSGGVWVVQARDIGGVGDTVRGDRIDQSGATAGRDVIGVQYNGGRDR